MGTAGAYDVPVAMMGKSPIECKALAVSVYRGFDIITVDAETIGMLSHTLGRLSYVCRNALVSTISDLTHSLKLKAVAEEVETEERSRLLRLLSCDEMQGFLFSKPVPAEIVETRFLALSPSAAA